MHQATKIPFAIRSLVSVALGCTSLNLFAQSANSPNSVPTDSPKMEETIVVSSRVPQPLRHIATAVSVLNQDQIERQGFSSLQDILRSQPGISVSNAGGAGKTSALRIRGEEGYRTLVMLDGIDISDTTSPQIGPRMEQLQSAGISRVEILRGPQGLMYGADAGGVIRISTARGEQGLHGQVSAEAGRYDSTRYSADVYGGTDSIDFTLSLSDQDTDGFSARTDDTQLRDDDGNNNTTWHGRIGWDATEQLRFELVLRNVDSNNSFDNCFDNSFSPSDSCSDHYEQSAGRGVISFNTQRFQNEISYARSDTDKQNYTANQATFGSKGDLELWNYLGSFALSDAHQLVYGAELEQASINDGSFDEDRDQTGYYGEYQGELLDNFFVTAGLRYDDNDDFGKHTSYRSSAAYLIPSQWGDVKLKASYGTGFRAPSLYEVTYNNTFATSPAAEVSLDEEKSKGFDVGLVWSGDLGRLISNATLELVYFDQQIEDNIYFDPVAFSGYLQDNGHSDSTGVEVVAELPLGQQFTLSGNYTYNDAEMVDGSSRVQRPDHLANLRLDWRSRDDKWQLALHARGSYDAVDTRERNLENYTVFDFNIRYYFNPHLEIFARVENLFDENYQEILPYNTSGAAGYIGLKLQM